MPTTVIVLPIQPGKKEKWLQMAALINSPAVKPKVDKLWRDVDLRRRVILQETPYEDFVIWTHEGKNPKEDFGPTMLEMISLLNRQPEVAGRFAAFLKEVHDLDLSEIQPNPSLICDSESPAG